MVKSKRKSSDKSVAEKPGTSSSASAQEELGPEEVVCRICCCSDQDENFISPCYCKGTVGAVHKSCLERWLATSNTTSCEICHYVYRVSVVRRYKCLPSICVWMKEKADRRHLVLDLVMLSLVSPLVAGGLYFCLNLPVLRHRKESGELSLSGSLTAGGLLVLCATILAAYLVWVISTMHHHIKAWHSWWTRSNLVTSISWIQGAHGKGKNNLARPNTAASHDWRIQERKTTTYNNNRNNVHCTTKYRNK